MSYPLVTIIIPCYNAAPYVAEAIESALNQNYPDKEVIVIDDGSTDDSLAVIKSFGDAVRHLSGKNCGAAAARNRGLALANGELVQFLDSDDLLLPEKLERQVPLTLQNENILVFCNGAVVDMHTQKRLGTWGRRFLPTSDPVVYVLTSVLQTAAPLHRKKNLVTLGGFREDMPPCDDPDLHLRLAMAGVQFRHLPEVLFTARRVAGSLSRSNRPRGLEMQSKLAWNTYEQLQRSDGLTEERMVVLAGFLANTARCALRIGLKEEAREYFAQARRMHPEGGIPQAYNRNTRRLYKLFGSELTERLVGWKRRLLAQHECA